MQILFITSTRIGDAVLSTGIMRHIVDTYPQAEVTVACGPLVTGFFEAVPNVKHVISLKKQKRAGHWIKLWKQVWTTKWGIVIDIRNSAVSRLIWADKRYIFGNHINQQLHKVVQSAKVLKLETVPSPKLWFSDDMMAQAKTLLKPDDRPIMAVGPAANWVAKTWPNESFIEVLTRLRAKGQPFENWRVAIIAAPGEEDQAQPVLESIPEADRIDLIAKGRPELAGACLCLCQFYIGNDSGLMHTAAACGIPTLGLFGPSWPHIYGPYGENTSYVTTPQNFAELIDYEGYDSKTAPCLMTGLSVDTVEAAAKELISRSS